MTIETIDNFALNLAETTSGLPFGPNVVVYKVQGKMFLLLAIDTSPLQYNVKCNPEIAIELREQYPDTILPGYHMNKQNWNTVIIDGKLSTTQLKSFITDSYNLIVASIKKPKK